MIWYQIVFTALVRALSLKVFRARFGGAEAGVQEYQITILRQLRSTKRGLRWYQVGLLPVAWMLQPAMLKSVRAGVRQVRKLAVSCARWQKSGFAMLEFDGARGSVREREGARGRERDRDRVC